jgi:MerR family transcriptional regulator, redox-sensitive transcriptional activator SoxR
LSYGIIVGVKVGLMSNPDPGPGSALLGIGELAKLTGKRPSAIRYYEQIGLLPQPERVDGRRRYHHGIVRTLAVIDTGQRAGLALEEIKTLLAASPDDGEAIGRLRDVAGRKLPQVIMLIERSQLVRDWLECAARCECPDLDQCPLFDDAAIPRATTAGTALTSSQPGPPPNTLKTDRG